jgi:hypothetical protein
MWVSRYSLSYLVRARREAPDRCGKLVAPRPSDRPAVNRPINNHDQSRHFPPFYNNSRCFNVTKMVSSGNKQALAIGRRSAGHAAGARQRSFRLSRRTSTRPWRTSSATYSSPGTSHHLDRTFPRLRILHHIRGKLGPIWPLWRFLGVRRGFRTLELSLHLLLMAPTMVVR